MCACAVSKDTASSLSFGVSRGLYRVLGRVPPPPSQGGSPADLCQQISGPGHRPESESRGCVWRLCCKRCQELTVCSVQGWEREVGCRGRFELHVCTVQCGSRGCCLLFPCGHVVSATLQPFLWAFFSPNLLLILPYLLLPVEKSNSPVSGESIRSLF